MKSLICLLTILFTISCANTPPAQQRTQTTSNRPIWVSNPHAFYPESEWLVFTGQGNNISSAEAVAIERLANFIEMDVTTTSRFSEQLIETTRSDRGMSSTTIRGNTDFYTGLSRVSNIRNLIGLQIETWVDPRTGEVYAITRMNRREGVAGYTELINHNERIITQIISQTDQEASFDSLFMINFAYKLAQLNDNFYSIRRALNSRYTGNRPSYGTANDIRNQVLRISNRIVISVVVTGDENNRLTRTFTEVLNSKGYRTGTLLNSTYVLKASIIKEDLPARLEDRFRYTRYDFNYTLTNRSGHELLSHTYSNRDGGRDHPQARQVIFREIEDYIRGAGFAGIFDEFLMSLM